MDQTYLNKKNNKNHQFLVDKKALKTLRGNLTNGITWRLPQKSLHLTQYLNMFCNLTYLFSSLCIFSIYLSRWQIEVWKMKTKNILKNDLGIKLKTYWTAQYSCQLCILSQMNQCNKIEEVINKGKLKILFLKIIVQGQLTDHYWQCIRAPH